MSEPRDLVERLSNVSACEPGCEGRCVECPDDVIRDAKAEILALRQRAEASKELATALAEEVRHHAKRLAEVEAALRPFAGARIGGQPWSFFSALSDPMWVCVGVPMGAWRAAAAALAKGGAG